MDYFSANGVSDALENPVLRAARPNRVARTDVQIGRLPVAATPNCDNVGLLFALRERHDG